MPTYHLRSEGGGPLCGLDFLEPPLDSEVDQSVQGYLYNITSTRYIDIIEEVTCAACVRVHLERRLSEMAEQHQLLLRLVVEHGMEGGIGPLIHGIDEGSEVDPYDGRLLVGRAFFAPSFSSLRAGQDYEVSYEEERYLIYPVGAPGTDGEGAERTTSPLRQLSVWDHLLEEEPL